MINFSRDSFTRWFTWAATSNLDSVREHGRQMEEAMSVGSARQYVILTQAHSLVGRIGLTQIDPMTRNAEMGYMLRSDFEGQGLMTEAAQGLLVSVLGPDRLHRITAFVDVDNISSQRLLARVGFRHEGTIRDMTYHPQRGWRSHELYGLLEGELRA